MNVLSLSKRIQHFIGVHRENLDDPKNYAIKLLLNVLFISGMMIVLVLGSCWYIMVNLLDLQNSTNTMMTLMAGGSGAASYIGITSNTKSIAKLYKILKDLADESLKYQGFYGFVEAEKKSYMLSKWFTMFIVLFFTFGTLFARAQIPHVFMGLKIVYCSLESFTKLNKVAATYYIMFRNISTR